MSRDAGAGAQQQRRFPRRANVLVAYGIVLEYPLRTSIEDHLYAFGRHSPHRVFYINLGAGGLPRRIRETRFDLVIFDTTLLSARWTPWEWRLVSRRALALPRRDEVRVAIPQDEFLRADVVGGFVAEADIDIVCSVATEGEWPKIYPTVDRGRVQFHKVLTGYLEERTVTRAASLSGPQCVRPVTVGYRARPSPPWLGRHGWLKERLAEHFRTAAASRSLRIDISTRLDDTLFGDDWFRFLSNCRYQLGVEGGASILDPDGSTRERAELYLADHPHATFEEVEEACFPGRDGELALFAISPRHLEACATRTCQVLVEGAYDGVLEPGRHYIEVKRDFSNLDDVLDAIERDDLRSALVENAYRDIVLSGRYSYRSFVEEVEGLALRSIAPHDDDRDDHAWRTTQRLDRVAWHKVAMQVRAVNAGFLVLGSAIRPLRLARRRRAARRDRHGADG